MSAVTLTTTSTDLRSLLRLGSDERLFGIVDEAQDLELAYEAKCIFGQEIHMLFEGDDAPALAEVAPYLVPIDPMSGYLENWEARRGKNAGILLVTHADLVELRRHLREIFVVQDEAGQEYFFRFYDPRVLGLFLTTCTPDERAAFFGPVSRITFEVAEAGGWKSADVGGERLNLEAGAQAMMVLRPEQIEQMAIRSSFPGRLLEHLQERLGQTGRPVVNRKLQAEIQEGMKRAKYYQLTRECDVADYVEIVCLLLGGFGDQPHPQGARGILYDHRQTPEVKLDRFRDWAVQNSTMRATR